MIDKEVEKSLSAIEQYIAKDKRNFDRHKANILLYSCGKDYGPGF